MQIVKAIEIEMRCPRGLQIDCLPTIVLLNKHTPVCPLTFQQQSTESENDVNSIEFTLDHLIQLVDCVTSNSETKLKLTLLRVAKSVSRFVLLCDLVRLTNSHQLINEASLHN